MAYEMSSVMDEPSLRVDYSPQASNPGPSYNPPLPGTSGFNRVRGRSGDLLVIQLKGMSGQNHSRRAVLKTLGLGRIHSASLRNSSDPTLSGNIRAVRDMIAIVVLPGKVYAPGSDARSEDEDANYESLKYGSGSRPGHLWRDSKGDYFAYEYEKNRLLALWSSDVSHFNDVVETTSSVGFEIDSGSDEAQIVISSDDDQTLRRQVGSWKEVATDLPNSNVVQAVIPVGNGTRVVWQANLRRFHDTDISRPCITIVTSPPDVLAIRALARATCAEGFLNQVPCRVVTREEGTIREYPVEP